MSNKNKKTICVKFIYSEKATKFREIFTLLLSYVVSVKSKVKTSQNFVAFSEYMNFICGYENKNSLSYIISTHCETLEFSHCILMTVILILTMRKQTFCYSISISISNKDLKREQVRENR